MKKLLQLYLLISFTTIYAQQDAWVYFTNKQNVETSIANPTTILTQKAIDRKAAHNVPIDYRDVPVNENYISQIKVQNGITVLAKSKWFNAIHVRGLETDIKTLLGLTFVDRIDFADKSLNTNRVSAYYQNHDKFRVEESLENFNYGGTLNQIQMINGNKLHELNYTGQGMTVAVLDAGFTNVKTIPAFQRMINAGNLLGGYDFPDRTPLTYSKHHHGTMVLSTMAGYIQDAYAGTAPDAQYYLFRTEVSGSENPVEESYWVEAAERADSLGVDVINTSLGYTTFDNPNYNYSNSDMNGTTTFISRGANIAFKKGMLLVNSAGNEGNKTWQIVSAPADSEGVLTVGAVTPLRAYASFSSIGSDAQAVQKPDVVAQGQSSAVINTSGDIVTANGTSFSSPILAGSVVCLWQALPSLSNAEIMQLVRESASQSTTPDNYLGYGIPDLQQALNLGLLTVDSQSELLTFNLHPNPTSDKIHLIFLEDFATVTIYDILGKKIKQVQIAPQDYISVNELSKGIYLAKIQTPNFSKTVKFIKQ